MVRDIDIQFDNSGVVFIETPKIMDHRGYFCELFSTSWKDTHPLLVDFTIRQVSTSLSDMHVLRGFHIQMGQHPMRKMMRVVQGQAQIASINTTTSPCLYASFINNVRRSAKNVWIFNPAHHATGFLALTNDTHIEYLHDEIYYPEDAFTIQWNSREINFPWHYYFPILSEKDQNGLTLATFQQLIKYDKSSSLQILG